MFGNSGRPATAATVHTVRDPSGGVDTAAIRRRGWAVTALLLAFMVVNYADKAAVGLAGVDIKADLGLSNEQFGLVQSSFYWLFAVGALVFTGLSDKIGARWLVGGLGALWCVSMVPLAGSAGFTLLIASRVVLGFAEGPASAVAAHVVHTWFTPRRRALPSSLIFTGVAIGPLLAAPILTWVITTFDWHHAFLVLIVAGALVVAAWLVVGKAGPVSSATTRESDTATGAVLPDRIAWSRLLRRPTLWGIALLLFCGYWSVSLKVTWLPLYLREGIGYSADESGWLVTLPYASGAVLSVLCGWLSGRMTTRGISCTFTRGVVPSVLFCATGLAMIGFTVVPRGWGQMILITLAFSLTTAVWGVAMAGLSDVVPGKQRGTVLGAVVAVHSLGGVIAPVVLGSFVDSGDTLAAGYGRGFLAAGVVIVVGSAIAAFLIKPDRDARVVAQVAAAG
ncbi:MFS transporter [Amycolatopsis sp. NPDC051903]|uniref:MFS transporter n=1 Tax=Amycolatopsis sp. NPDC051903 TaxID=3363936 RepID=UPI0037A5EC3B